MWSEARAQERQLYKLMAAQKKKAERRKEEREEKACFG